MIGGSCSSGTTEQVVVKYQDKLNIRYLRRPSNLDSAENLNQLYRSAQDRYVLYYANDGLSILIETNKNLEIFEHSVAVGVIFAPWFIRGLPTRQDITSFYCRDDNYLTEQHDYAKLLTLILPYRIFPGVYLVHHEVFGQLYFVAPGHVFWASVHTAEILRSRTFYLSRTPFYRPVAYCFGDETHAQTNNEEVKYTWDRYCSSLKYALDKFAPTSAPNEW